jgi:hypothetical protein
MEVRSSRRMRTLVTRMAHRGLSANEIARALISMMAQSTTLQSKAGYIDARPPTASSAKSTCNARPDHTFGSKSEVSLLSRHVCCTLKSSLSVTWSARPSSAGGLQRKVIYFLAIVDPVTLEIRDNSRRTRFVKCGPRGKLRI